MIEIVKILERNGFVKHPVKELRYCNEKCFIDIKEDHYQVSHWDKDFVEWMDWFSNDLNIPALMGYLSWSDFIERGYNK